MRGPKPQSITAGTSPIAEVPKAPSWLSRPAKAEWNRVAPILVLERNVLTEADLAALQNYVIACATMQDAHRELQASGLLIDGKRNPASTILLQAQQQQLRAAGELGLTPASRSRPTMRESADEDLSYLD